VAAVLFGAAKLGIFKLKEPPDGQSPASRG